MRKTQVLRIDDRILALFLKLLCYFFITLSLHLIIQDFKFWLVISFLFSNFKICLYVHFFNYN